ncbi:ATP-binding protein [Allomuricauda taeanensis]|nr:ATP-binding protein [Allomuricauda taeanensis]
MINLEFDEAKVSLASLREDSSIKLYQDLIYVLERKENLTLDESLYTISNSLDFKNKEQKALSYLVKGNYGIYVYPYKSETYNYLIEAYSLIESTSNSELIKLTLISILEFYQKFISQSNLMYQEYLQEFKDVCEDKIDYAWYYIYSVILKSKSIYELDRSYFEDHRKLDSIFRLIPDTHYLNSYYNLEVGLRYQLQKKNDSARYYYSKNLEAHFDRPFLSYKRFASQLKISNILAESNNYKEALNGLWKSVRYIGRGADTLRNYYYLEKYAAEYHYNLSHFDSAYFHLKQADDIGDKIEYRLNSIETVRLNVELDTYKKEKQILEEQQKVRTNRNWLITASLALLLGTGIAVLLQKNTIKKQLLAEQEVLLKQQRVENLLKEQELVSIDAMVQGQEKERKKVAGELHDDLGSLMATIKLHFDNANSKIQDPAFHNAQKLLDEAYQKIRNMAHTKSSGVMSDQGLLGAIKKMAKVISETGTLKVMVEDFGMGERIENSLELSIFRMVQELVANAIKHAEATKVNIQLTQHEDNLNIIVEDNGKGFNRSKLDRDTSGIGLTNIEKRVEHLEGNFTVDSVLGKGTSILIDIPL